MKSQSVFIIYTILSICVLSGCSQDSNAGRDKEIAENNLFASQDQVLISPSEIYGAYIEEFDDNGVKSYCLYIKSLNSGNQSVYKADITFRARDVNYIFWADEADILWGYSGDIGTYLWVRTDNTWVKEAYADNIDAEVPQALKNAMPNLYNTPTIDKRVSWIMEEYMTEEEIVGKFYNNYDAFSDVAEYLLAMTEPFRICQNADGLFIDQGSGVFIDVDSLEVGKQISVVCDSGFNSIRKHQTEPTVYFSAPSDIGEQGVLYARDGLANKDIPQLKKENWYYFSLRHD